MSEGGLDGLLGKVSGPCTCDNMVKMFADKMAGEGNDPDVLMSGQLPFKGETPEETKDNILRVQFKFEWLYKECTMEGTRLLMWIFKRKPHARPSLEEVNAHRWTNPADYMLKKRERARFPTNRIQKFAKDYHKSRPAMDMDSQSFMARLIQ